MGWIHEVIDALRHEPSSSGRGTKFEQLMVRSFELDPMFAVETVRIVDGLAASATEVPA